MLQVGSIALPRRGIGIIYFRSVNPLKSLHRAYRAYKLQAGIIVEQIVGEIKGQRRGAIRRHEIADLQSHLSKISICRREFVLPVFYAQHGMLVFSPIISITARNTKDYDGGLLEVFLVGIRIQKIVE